MLHFHVLLLSASGNALTVSFDAAVAQLAVLSRLFIEPDGSFVWTGEEAGQPWQVDGNLIDRGDFLAYVELKGRCPEEHFNELTSAFGWPQSPLEFQLPRRGVTLDETEFRKLAVSDPGAI